MLFPRNRLISLNMFWILINGYTTGSLIVLFVQQVIVASSTLWIALLGQSLVEKQPSFLFFILFTLSLIIVYIPAILSLMLLETAKVKTLDSCIEMFILKNRGNTTIWPDKHQRDTTNSYLATETFLVLDEFMNSGYDLLSLIMNVLLNVIMLGYVLTQWFFGAYAIGIIFLITGLRSMGHWVNTTSTNMQRNRVDVNSVLSKAWDNVILNNVYNFDMWYLHKNDIIIKFKNSTANAAIVREGVAAFSMIGMIVAVMGLISYEIIINQANNNVAYLAILAVTLPRQIQVLQNTYAISSQVSRLFSAWIRISNLFENLFNKKEDITLDSRIKFDQIKIWHSKHTLNFDKFTDLLSSFASLTHGRITIRGSNGSGKTSMLLALKHALGKEAFFLPHSHYLEFGVNLAVSSGELTLSILDKLQYDKIYRYVILDEWDSNLDGQNLAEVNILLDTLAKSLLIIESRHRF